MAAGKLGQTKVAIVGGGPSGKAAARVLAEAGAAVTIFEKEPETGGLMRYGYPSFRMPTSVSARDAKRLGELGITIVGGRELGRNLELAELERRFDAVLLAVGAPKPRRLAVPGEQLPGVYPVLQFLYGSRQGEPVPVGQRVLVVGGGDTAIDAATTAVWLGSPKVEIWHRRSEPTLSAQPHELARARAAAVRFRFWREVTGISLYHRANQSALKVGYLSRLPETSQTPESAAFGVFDTVIVAVGQERNTPFFTQLGVRVKRDGITSRPKVFVAGGTLYGSDRLARAITDGRRAAAKIIEFLG